jgi:uncharacterized protein YjbI with pentapeptide repeats
VESLLSYEESFALAVERLGIDGKPRPDPAARPAHDDDPFGPSLFRTRVEDADLQGLRLPGLYICRAELISVSIRQSDLRLSVFNWSDFASCDFSGSDLRDTDLRACNFIDTSFNGSDLGGADLRASRLRDCSFTGASLLGATALKSQRGSLPLTRAQRAQIRWIRNEEPPAGGGMGRRMSKAIAEA